MKKTKLMLLLLLVVFFIALTFSYQCPFKKILHIACPGCGLTRSIFAILHGHFIESFQYNILGLPIFIFLIYSIIRIFYDIIHKQDTYILKIYNLTVKYWYIILIILFINMLINNIRGI